MNDVEFKTWLIAYLSSKPAPKPSEQGALELIQLEPNGVSVLPKPFLIRLQRELVNQPEHGEAFFFIYYFLNPVYRHVSPLALLTDLITNSFFAMARYFIETHDVKISAMDKLLGLNLVMHAALHALTKDLVGEHDPLPEAPKAFVEFLVRERGVSIQEEETDGPRMLGVALSAAVLLKTNRALLEFILTFEPDLSGRVEVWDSALLVAAFITPPSLFFGTTLLRAGAPLVSSGFERFSGMAPESEDKPADSNLYISLKGATFSEADWRDFLLALSDRPDITCVRIKFEDTFLANTPDGGYGFQITSDDIGMNPFGTLFQDAIVRSGHISTVQIHGQGVDLIPAGVTDALRSTLDAFTAAELKPSPKGGKSLRYSASSDYAGPVGFRFDGESHQDRLPRRVTIGEAVYLQRAPNYGLILGEDPVAEVPAEAPDL